MRKGLAVCTAGAAIPPAEAKKPLIPDARRNILVARHYSDSFPGIAFILATNLHNGIIAV